MLRLATRAMGTRFELVLAREDEPCWRAAGEAALECIEACDERWSLFSSSSLVARINREAARTPVRLDPELYELLERCLELREMFDGAFDVAIGRRMRALGFRGEPAAATHAREGFELDPMTRSIRFTTPDTALDLGSIAKGHALDLAAALLREHGVDSALLHGGTSSVARRRASAALAHDPSRSGPTAGRVVAVDLDVLRLQGIGFDRSCSAKGLVRSGLQADGARHVCGRQWIRAGPKPVVTNGLVVCS
ncbi:MAG: FAD:protein FMN transferase [Planctomycetaceae bacterium]|nr:FAD:protein FMN transferase [Planctomycetaceae bacterium]